MQIELDVTDALPAIRVPALVIYEGARTAEAASRSPRRSRTASISRRARRGHGDQENDFASRRSRRSWRELLDSGFPNRSRDRPVHRSRGLDERPPSLGDREWRELLSAAPRDRAYRARALSRRGDRHRGRRLLRQLRRPGAGDRAARATIVERVPRARPRGSRRRPHRRMRECGREGRRDRGHRWARACPRPQGPARCWSREPSRISLPALESSSRTAALTS